MRRFFIRNLERLLNVLVVLSALAVIALAVQTAMDAAGDQRMLLQALAILLGGLTGVIAVAGVAYLAISMNAHLARLVSASKKGERAPLAANRGHISTAAPTVEAEPKEIRRAPRSAPPLTAPVLHHGASEPAAKQRETAPHIEPVKPRTEPSLARPAPLAEPEPVEFEENIELPQHDPAPQPVRPVFTGQGMPRLSHKEAVSHAEKAQDEPAPSHPVFRSSRLVADPRPRR